MLSRHFFEHLTYAQADLTLQAWYKILKPGGEIITIVPDMEFHIKQWLNPDRKTTVNELKGGTTITDLEWAIHGFWGWQNEKDLKDYWDVHKSGYDYVLLKEKFEEHQFINISRIRAHPKNLTIEAFK